MSVKSDQGEALETPVCHRGELSESTPLVWVGDSEAVSAELIRRVAAHVGGAPESQDDAPGIAGAFGARQRPWLTRLTWAGGPPGERRLIRSATFLDAAKLAAMAQDMPSEAIVIPAEHDGVVDGLTEEGTVMFYALYAGGGPWRPAPLAPVPPPFEGLTSPLLLGPVPERLIAWSRELREGALDSTALELVESAMAVVTSDRR